MEARIVEPYVGLLGPADPVDSGRGMADAAVLLAVGHSLGNRAKQRAGCRIEHSMRGELDHKAKHIVVLEQVGDLGESGRNPSKVERIGTQTCVYANIAFRRRCAVFIVHGEQHAAAVRQFANAALDHLAGSIAVQNLKPEGEADLLVRRLELRRASATGDSYAAHRHRVVNNIGENCGLSCGGKYTHRQHRASRILWTGEGEKVADV